MHDEHVLNHSSKNSSEIIQSKEIKNVNVNSTSSPVIIVHDNNLLGYGNNTQSRQTT
jgi:glutaredoxin